MKSTLELLKAGELTPELAVLALQPMTGFGRDQMFDILTGISDLQTLVYNLNVRAGWWSDLETGAPKERNDGELIALMHSELSEGLEALRKDLMDDKLTHRKGIEVELADCVIRILDYCGGRDLDLAGAIVEKIAFNAERADHKTISRSQDHGKKF